MVINCAKPLLNIGICLQRIVEIFLADVGSVVSSAEWFVWILHSLVIEVVDELVDEIRLTLLKIRSRSSRDKLLPNFWFYRLDELLVAVHLDVQSDVMKSLILRSAERRLLSSTDYPVTVRSSWHD